MNTKEANTELSRIFEQWRAEDRKLASCIEEIQGWMSEVNQLGIPHFGETASRLQPLYESLVIHFDREDELIGKLTEFYTDTSPEVQAFKRQTRLDHEALLARLDQLRQKLKETDPQFDSWTAAMNEVDLFCEEVEQHERSEADRFEMLIPGAVSDS